MADQEAAAAALAEIRQLLTGDGRLTANPGDSELDLVRRLAHMAWPEGAAAHWFGCWQEAYRLAGRMADYLQDPRPGTDLASLVAEFDGLAVSVPPNGGAVHISDDEQSCLAVTMDDAGVVTVQILKVGGAELDHRLPAEAWAGIKPGRKAQ